MLSVRHRAACPPLQAVAKNGAAQSSGSCAWPTCPCSTCIQSVRRLQDLLLRTNQVLERAHGQHLVQSAWQSWQMWLRHLRHASARAAAVCADRQASLLSQSFVRWAQYSRAMQSDVNWQSPFLLSSEVLTVSEGHAGAAWGSPEQLRISHEELALALHAQSSGARSLSPQAALSPARLLERSRRGARA